MWHFAGQLPSDERSAMQNFRLQLKFQYDFLALYSQKMAKNCKIKAVFMPLIDEISGYPLESSAKTSKQNSN